MTTIKRFLSSKNGKNIPKWIKNSPFFKSYDGKLVKAFPKIGLKNKVNKNYCKIDDQKIDLVFSSKMWDIATMSMRGVYSCMQWKEQPEELIGSMVDPFVGIIYLTNNKRTKYGKKMLWRAVVKLIVVDNEPSIFIEDVYNSPDEEINKPDYDDCRETACAGKYRKLFVAYLSKQLKKSYKVLTKLNANSFAYHPVSKIAESLSDDYQSYSDAGINYAGNLNKKIEKLGF